MSLFLSSSLLVIFLSLSMLSAQQPLLPVDYAGMEVIFDVGSYCSNLVIDPFFNTDRIYFLCDQSSPNLMIANTNQFSVSTQKNLIGQPFISFAVLNNNIVGSAYPRDSNSSNFVIQELQTKGNSVIAMSSSSPNNCTFFSFLADPFIDLSTNTTKVFMAGWSTLQSSLGFIIARGTMDYNSVEEGVIIVDYEDDILTSLFQEDCYDLFNELNKPKMYYSNGNQNIIVVVPGRCGYVFNISINLPFRTSTFTSFNLRVDHKHYTSGFDFDGASNMLYYVDKMYRNGGGMLYALDLANNYTFASEILLAGLGSGPALVSAYNNSIFVSAISGNFIMVATWNSLLNPPDFQEEEFKTLPYNLSKVSSSLILIRNGTRYLYFTTNERSSKLVRTRADNFCFSICPENGYCQDPNTGCVCLPGYNMTDTVPPICEVQKLYVEEMQQVRIHRAEIGIAVIFGVTVVIAGVGWLLFFKTQDQSQNQPLLGATNLASIETHENL